MQKKLDKWTAKRAGGRITILHAEGKVPHVDKITCERGKVLAIDKDGKQYELAVAA